MFWYLHRLCQVNSLSDAEWFLSPDTINHITKASLLAGVGFPLGMYWEQSWGRGSDLSHRRFLAEASHSHEGPPPTLPPPYLYQPLVWPTTSLPPNPVSDLVPLTFAPQLESIRFAFPLFAHNIKASDFVPLLLHQKFKAAVLLTWKHPIWHRSFCNTTSKHPISYHYFFTTLQSIRFGTATLAPQLQSIRFGTTTFSPHFKASDLVPLLLQRTFTASDLVPLL